MRLHLNQIRMARGQFYVGRETLSTSFAAFLRQGAGGGAVEAGVTTITIVCSPRMSRRSRSRLASVRLHAHQANGGNFFSAAYRWRTIRCFVVAPLVLQLLC